MTKLQLTILIVALAVGITVLVLGGLLLYFKNHSVFEQAMALLRADPVVVGQIGEPVEADFMVYGRIKNRAARVNIPLRGSKGRGDAVALATKRDGNWVLDRLRFTPAGREPIELKVSR